MSDENSYGTTTGNFIENCPGCHGAKVQTRFDGIKVLCPVCGGRGTFQPFSPMYKVTCSAFTDELEESTWQM
jgi:hypothetical protein